MHVLVLGGGPAGLSAALCLSRSLTDCTIDVLEKYGDYAVRGSTLGIQTNGIKALKVFCTNDSITTLVDSGVAMADGAFMLAWWMLHNWLLRQVKEDPQISLHMGIEVTSLDESEEPWVRLLSKQGVFQGDLLIGADGVHSQLRSLLNLSRETPTGRTVWRGSAVVNGKEEPLHSVLDMDFHPFPIEVLGGSITVNIFNHHPKLSNQINWVIGTTEKVQEGPTGKGVTPWDILEPHMRDHKRRQVFQALLESSNPKDLTRSMKMATIELPKPEEGTGWGGRGRVTLIGDCAHAMRPTAGQGCSLAFEDVVVLSRTLKRQNPTSRKDWESALREFENERLPRVHRIAQEQARLVKELYGGKSDVASSSEYKRWLSEGV